MIIATLRFALMFAALPFIYLAASILDWQAERRDRKRRERRNKHG